MKPTIPVTPTLFSMALRPLPLAPLQSLLTALLSAIIRQHPRFFDRFGVHIGKRFGIDPTDLPFAFVLELSPGTSRIAIVRVLPDDRLDARIAAPFFGLLGLANGMFDGDALFFSRDLVIEGDVEAILALRNAMDDAGVDIVRDAAACFGAFGPPLERAMRITSIFMQELAPFIGGRQWN